jgi:hypothetical protein
LRTPSERFDGRYGRGVKSGGSHGISLERARSGAETIFDSGCNGGIGARDVRPGGNVGALTADGVCDEATYASAPLVQRHGEVDRIRPRGLEIETLRQCPSAHTEDVQTPFITQCFEVHLNVPAGTNRVEDEPAREENGISNVNGEHDKYGRGRTTPLFGWRR